MRPRALESNVPSRAVTVWPSSSACHTTTSPRATSSRGGVKRWSASTPRRVRAGAGRGDNGPITAVTSVNAAPTRQVTPLIGTVLPDRHPVLTAGPPLFACQPVLSTSDDTDGCLGEEPRGGSHLSPCAGAGEDWRRINVVHVREHPAPRAGPSPIGRTHVTTTESRHSDQKDGGVGTTVVLDTCVLLADPFSLYSFGDAAIVIPLNVIEELDGHKRQLDDVGQAARAVVRDLERLRVDSGGDFREPVPLSTGGGPPVGLYTLVLEPDA